MYEIDVEELVEPDLVLAVLNYVIDQKYMDEDVQLETELKTTPGSDESKLHWRTKYPVSDELKACIQNDVEQVADRLIDLNRQAKEFITETVKRSDEIYKKTHRLMDELNWKTNEENNR